MEVRKMKKSNNISLKIQKPVKPHRQITAEEIPSKSEIRRRYERIRQMKKLGISTATLDMERSSTDEYEEDLDKLKASILIMQDKEVPIELEQRIMEKNNR
jgi:hypothetical protein